MAPTKLPDHNFRITVGAGREQPAYQRIQHFGHSFGALSATPSWRSTQAPSAAGLRTIRGRLHLAAPPGAWGRSDLGSGVGYFAAATTTAASMPKVCCQCHRSQVKMIEPAQPGAKPGHGGMLPGPKVTAEIAAARGVPVGVDCVSPASHSAFSTPIEMMQFIDRLRTLSGGKPTGFKLCIGHPWEWFAMVKAMLATGITPDFIVVDGAEGGTGGPCGAPPTMSAHRCRKATAGTTPCVRGPARQDQDRLCWQGGQRLTLPG